MATIPQDASHDIRIAFGQINDEMRSLRRENEALRDQLNVSAGDSEKVRRDLEGRLDAPSSLDFNDIFRGAGPAHAIGYVPDPGETARPEGFERYLRGDGDWRAGIAPILMPGERHQIVNIPGHTHVAGALMASKITAGGDSNIIGSLSARSYIGILLGSFAFSSGQGNSSGPQNDELTSYTLTVPANSMSQPGDLLMINGTGLMASTANERRFAISLGASEERTLLATTTNLANMVTPIYAVIRRRTSTNGSITGVPHINASGATPVGGTDYLVNKEFTGMDFTIDQELKIYAYGTTAGDAKLTDYSVFLFRVEIGVTV